MGLPGSHRVNQPSTQAPQPLRYKRGKFSIHHPPHPPHPAQQDTASTFDLSQSLAVSATPVALIDTNSSAAKPKPASQVGRHRPFYYSVNDYK